MESPRDLRGVTPPNSLEAERSVLGAMLQDEHAVMVALEHLKQDDFYQPAHRELFSAMLALHQSQMPIDFVTVDAELNRRGTLEGVGGTAYLVELGQYVPTTANVRAYITLVQEKSTFRKMIQSAQQILQESYSQEHPLQATMEHAEKSIFDIVMGRAGVEQLIPIEDVLPKTLVHVQELFKLKGGISGVPTGFTVLDELLTGMHGGELILVGARPAMGKSSFAMNIASHAAVVEKKRVALFSLEMPREQIALRLLCSEARVNMQKVRRGNLDNDDWMRLARAVGPLSKAPLYLDETPAMTPTMLRSRCRRLMMDKGLDLIIVDYLGLMRADGKTENRQLEVSEISRQLKAIALELRIPLIACAQLSRAAANRVDKRPMLSDLRDSGAIEQDADVVMFLHREQYYDADTEEKNVAEVIVSKQRNGPLGTVKLAWLGEFTTFVNMPDQGGDTPY